MLKKLILIFSLCAALFLTACYQTPAYNQPWYNVYGGYCGSGYPRPGCNFYGNGFKISANEDPYSYNQYYQFGLWSYTDSYGYYRTYYGWAWQSSTGILYDEYGRALNQDGEQDGRDLIAQADAQEKQVVDTVGKQFAATHALSEETGVSIARTLNDWATLSKKQKRARTVADIADFSKRLYGVSVEKAKSAIDAAKGGDMSQLESVNAEVAAHWGTSPETSKAILKSWYKKQLSDMGVDLR